MSYAAKIIADSTSQAGVRLTTFEITYPKFVHNELMTHRMFSRNTASSRAIPYAKIRQQVLDDPVMPVWWGKNQAGMQAREEMDGGTKYATQQLWLAARNEAVSNADELHAKGLHKQIVNRVIEPWMWITAIVTATDFDNFFHLRCHPDAQPEIKHIADMMRDLYYANELPSNQVLSTRDMFKQTGWHLPYVNFDDYDYGLPLDQLCRISVARCARVSYLTHDGKRDHAEDLKLCDRLQASGHWSPFEHVARPAFPQVSDSFNSPEYYGNFRGWIQFRKQFADEYCIRYERTSSEQPAVP